MSEVTIKATLCISFSHGDDMIVTPFAQVSPCYSMLIYFWGV